MVRGSLITARSNESVAYIRVGDNGSNKDSVEFYSRYFGEAYPGRLQININSGLLQLRAPATGTNSGYDDILMYPNWSGSTMYIRAKGGAGALGIDATNVGLSGDRKSTRLNSSP